jgi:hypothetical protein
MENMRGSNTPASSWKEMVKQQMKVLSNQARTIKLEALPSPEDQTLKTGRHRVRNGVSMCQPSYAKDFNFAIVAMCQPPGHRQFSQ